MSASGYCRGGRLHLDAFRIRSGEGMNVWGIDADLPLREWRKLPNVKCAANPVCGQ
jgi:hypothetical protein